MTQPDAKRDPVPFASNVDAIARPKLMRRPARFSSSAASLTASEADASQPPLFISDSVRQTSKSTAPHPTTTWQDDGRFVLVLLCLLVLINLALGFWLGRSHHPQPVIVRQQATDLIEPLPASERGVSVFSAPATNASVDEQ